MPARPTVKGPHDEWQGQVIEAAGYLGWRHLHVRRTKGKNGWTTSTNVEGWPDLYLWNARRGGFAGIELKVDRDLPRANQVEVLYGPTGLAAAGALVAIAWPADLDRLVAMLRPGGESFPRYTGRLRTT